MIRAMLSIREGSARDAEIVLALFDEAVEWLVARGQTGQWGTEPFSAVDRRVDAVREWSSGGGLRIASLDDHPAGALVLGPRWDWVEPVERPELYVRALVTSRRFAGRDIGGALVRRAIEEARAGGAELLRVDCWAGAPALVAWYERQGFVRSGTFEVGGWHGQVLSLDPNGRTAQ
jgi:GNAT superfamily N-acetyltransferase